MRKLERKARSLQSEVFAKLTPLQKVQLSRHPQRPFTLDYVARLFTDFVELHGDRAFGDDAALVGGLARFRGQSDAFVGQLKSDLDAIDAAKPAAPAA